MKNNIKIILPEGDGKQKPIPINEDAPGPKPKSTPEPIKK